MPVRNSRSTLTSAAAASALAALCFTATTAAAAGSACAGYVSSERCVGDRASACSWVALNAAGTSTAEAGLCVHSCGQYNNNATACNAAAPSCTFVASGISTTTGECRIPNACAGLNGDACTAKPYCAAVSPNDTAAIAAYGRCRVRCEAFGGNYCISFFGAYCTMTETTAATCGNIAPQPSTTVAPTRVPGNTTVANTTKAPIYSTTAYNTTKAPVYTTTTARPTEKPYDACIYITDQKACMNANSTATGLKCVWHSVDIPAKCAYRSGFSPDGTATNGPVCPNLSQEECTRQDSCIWEPASVGGVCNTPETRPTTIPAYSTTTYNTTKAPVHSTTTWAPTRPAPDACSNITDQKACVTSSTSSGIPGLQCVWHSVDVPATCAYRSGFSPDGAAAGPVCPSLSQEECTRQDRCIWEPAHVGGVCAAPETRPTTIPSYNTTAYNTTKAPVYSTTTVAPTRPTEKPYDACIYITDQKACMNANSTATGLKCVWHSVDIPAKCAYRSGFSPDGAAAGPVCPSLSQEECTRQDRCIWESASVGGVCNTPETRPTTIPAYNTTYITTNAPVHSTTTALPTRPTEKPPVPTSTAVAPTRVPPQCVPSDAPLIALDGTVAANGTSLAAPYARGQWIRFTAAVRGPYEACGVDVSGLVRFTWSLHRPLSPGSSVAYIESVKLPASAVTVGGVFAIPPYALDASSEYFVIVRAIYVGPMPTNTQLSSSGSWRIYTAAGPAPTVALPGGDVTIAASQPLDLFATVRIPCDATGPVTTTTSGAASTAAECERSNDGLRPFACTGDKCATSAGPSAASASEFSWSCTVISGKATSCGEAVTAALRLRETSYTSGRLVFGTAGVYNLTAVYYYHPNGNASLAPIVVAASRRVTVVAGDTPTPSLTLVCPRAAQSISDYVCVATVKDSSLLRFRWTVDGIVVLTGTSGSLTVAASAVAVTTVSVSVLAGNSDATVATATERLPAAPRPVLSCAAISPLPVGDRPIALVGLQTTAVVRCSLTSDAYAGRNPSISLSYRSAGNAAAPLSALGTAALVPLVPTTTSAAGTVSANATFVAPPVSGTVEVVVRAMVGDSIIATAVVPSRFAVTFTFNSTATDSLKEKMADGAASKDPSATANAAAQLAQAARNSGAPPTSPEVRDAASAVIDAVVAAVTGGSSASTPPVITDATARAAAEAIAGAVLATARNASSSSSSATSGGLQSTLSEADRAAAAKALTEVAAQSAAASTDTAHLTSLLTAAEALAGAGEANVAPAVANGVLQALIRRAPVSGESMAAGGSGAVRTAVSNFVATDAATTRTASDDVGNAVELPRGFAVGAGLLPSQVASLTATTTPAPSASASSSSSAMAPAAGQRFASAVTQLNVYVDGTVVSIANRTDTPIYIRLYVGNASAAASVSAAAASGRLVVRYWDTASNKWATAGVTTLAKCSDHVRADGSSASSSSSASVSYDATYICALTTHFTSFAVFASDGSDGDDDGSSTGITAAIIIGIIVAAVLVVGITVLVVAKVRSARGREKALQHEHDYDANSVPLSELSAV